MFVLWPLPLSCIKQLIPVIVKLLETPHDDAADALNQGKADQVPKITEEKK